jgi:tRNA (guanine-N(7)-)-methyltransferase subunit TRM82
MPKRPSAIVISPDLQIICADKFGDVYSLPLLPDESIGGTSGGTTTTVPHRSVKPGFTPSANTFTVHSKRNRQALEHQKKQMERNQQQKAKPGEAASAQEDDGAAAVPDFEMSLLLGHVSMLTALTLAESDGRRYIITGDRDEHVRVSRYIPQAHVIEGYCFGHKDFVNSLLVPAGRPEILVSGGGDPELFVWDWKNGNAHKKTNVLSLAKKIAPETSKVAVSGLYSLQYPHDGEQMTFVLATCERYVLSSFSVARCNLAHEN